MKLPIICIHLMRGPLFASALVCVMVLQGAAQESTITLPNRQLEQPPSFKPWTSMKDYQDKDLVGKTKDQLLEIMPPPKWHHSMDFTEFRRVWGIDYTHRIQLIFDASRVSKVRSSFTFRYSSVDYEPIDWSYREWVTGSQ